MSQILWKQHQWWGAFLEAVTLETRTSWWEWGDLNGTSLDSLESGLGHESVSDEGGGNWWPGWVHFSIWGPMDILEEEGSFNVNFFFFLWVKAVSTQGNETEGVIYICYSICSHSLVKITFSVFFPLCHSLAQKFIKPSYCTVEPSLLPFNHFPLYHFSFPTKLILLIHTWCHQVLITKPKQVVPQPLER
jgi:hypothetical protein